MIRSQKTWPCFLGLKIAWCPNPTWWTEHSRQACVSRYLRIKDVTFDDERYLHHRNHRCHCSTCSFLRESHRSGRYLLKKRRLSSVCMSDIHRICDKPSQLWRIVTTFLCSLEVLDWATYWCIPWKKERVLQRFESPCKYATCSFQPASGIFVFVQ